MKHENTETKSLIGKYKVYQIKSSFISNANKVNNNEIKPKNWSYIFPR